MRQLVPACAPMSPSELYLDLEPGDDAAQDRPWVALQMVASVEGVIAVDGSSSDLGGEADHSSFRRLRGRADVVMVAAGTARDEDYGPVRPHDPEERAARARRGQGPRARLAIVTRSGNLRADARMFTETKGCNGDVPALPVVITTGSAEADQLAEVADVRRHGEDDVDLAAALRELHAEGVRWVTVEGGPSFNASMLRAGLVDEIFLTRAATLAGRAGGGIIDGELDGLVELDLIGLIEHDSELLLRYRLR